MSELVIYDPKNPPPPVGMTDEEWHEQAIEALCFTDDALAQMAISAKGVALYLESDAKLKKLDRENLAELLSHFSNTAEQLQDETRTLTWNLAREWHVDEE